jgi:hypothetical protein
VLRCGMVCVHGMVRTLASHTVSVTIRRWNRGLVALKSEMRRSSDLRTSMVRAWGRIGRLRRLAGRHCVTSRNKRLRLGVERVIPVIAPWNRMLALWIMGIGIDWQLPVCVRDPKTTRLRP